MRKIILYIAISTDGYIADINGGVDWLEGQTPQDETKMEGDNGYSRLLSRIDTVVMGWRTYHQIVTQLSPQEWPYPCLHTYVLTHREGLRDTEEISFTSQSPVELARTLLEKSGRDIWICGGAQTAAQLMEAELIDEYHLSIIPCLLGGGIRLFPDAEKPMLLLLEESWAENGIVNCVYTRR